MVVSHADYPGWHFSLGRLFPTFTATLWVLGLIVLAVLLTFGLQVPFRNPLKASSSLPWSYCPIVNPRWARS